MHSLTAGVLSATRRLRMVLCTHLLLQCLVPLVSYGWCYALSVQVRNACDSDHDDDCDIDGELVMV